MWVRRNSYDLGFFTRPLIRHGRLSGAWRSGARSALSVAWPRAIPPSPKKLRPALRCARPGLALLSWDAVKHGGVYAHQSPGHSHWRIGAITGTGNFSFSCVCFSSTAHPLWDTEAWEGENKTHLNIQWDTLHLRFNKGRDRVIIHPAP